ncbi:acylneuraminate cytidylyltransferase family protein [Elioraea rosea]|uniref:acylneuraminate cytidylyltransferase family protein n=1 Tax=Elioraea rosea TaxID=2492390 RepID=UPI001183EA68|nr:acylneuraminate cytidylyltransferase family protein [Elioraea rosea]
MHRLAVMPARGGSKRIPRKNIVPFCGAPLMVHSLRAARDSGLFTKIHVTTDDPEIAAVAAAEGFPPDFPRDPKLADDHTPLLPVLAWVLAQYDARQEHFDSVTLLMPTAPLIEACDLAAAHATFERHGSLRPILGVTTFPVPVEWAMRRSKDGTMMPIQPGMDQVRSQDLPEAWYHGGTFLILPRSALVAGAAKPVWVGHPVARWKTVDIDTPEDLELAEKLFLGSRTAR